MKSILKRLLLAALLFVNLSTLLLDWQVIEGITSRNGVLVLSGNIVLSGIILCIYFLSLLLYKKLKTICFISGLCSLSMLFALEFSKFESYGRFSNSAIGVYWGLLTMIITIAAFILLLRKKHFLPINKNRCVNISTSSCTLFLSSLLCISFEKLKKFAVPALCVSAAYTAFVTVRFIYIKVSAKIK